MKNFKKWIYDLFFGHAVEQVQKPVFEPVMDKYELVEVIIDVEEKFNEPSFIKFNIGEDLNVTLETNVNADTLASMIKAEYLNEVESEQEEVIHLAAVVLAGDIVTGIIEDINGD